MTCACTCHVHAHTYTYAEGWPTAADCMHMSTCGDRMHDGAAQHQDELGRDAVRREDQEGGLQASLFVEQVAPRLVVLLRVRETLLEGALERIQAAFAHEVRAATWLGFGLGLWFIVYVIVSVRRGASGHSGAAALPGARKCRWTTRCRPSWGCVDRRRGRGTLSLPNGLAVVRAR